MSSIIGLSGIIFALWFTTTHEAGGFTGYLDKASIVLLGVVPPCVMLLSHTVKDFFTGFSILLNALFNRQKSIEHEVINVLTQSSAMVRAQGIGSLVKIRNVIKYELLKDGISLIINDFTADEIRHNLTNKINSKQTRMGLASSLFDNMSKVSPGVGMLGTLLGLIAMMANLKDPTKIGGGMALAMITTLYGVILGTLIYGPWGEKIAIEAEKSLEIDLMVLEGVVSLKAKKSSIHMHDIMSTYGSKKVAASPVSQRRSTPVQRRR
ncbi:MAG: MotA/TolQ/ExbB proton channel family protein [Oligoflexales bacterium]|nr:MotA/TolQ/ExbB proton channel family protein [Oligoflexales bacterium]